MRTPQCVDAVGATLVVMLSMSACQSTPRPALDGLVRNDARPSDPRLPQLRFVVHGALKGLSFETDRVVVATPSPHLDRARAERFIQTGAAALEAGDQPAAVEAFAGAVRAAPDLPAAYLQLGRALMLGNHAGSATACFRTAVTLEPKSIDARIALANALASEMRHHQAIAEMQAALLIDPQHGLAHERLAVWYYFKRDYPAAWTHVHAAQRAGKNPAPHFLRLLTSRMPQPPSTPDP